MNPFFWNFRIDDERLCCELVIVLKCEVLPHVSKLPSTFLSDIVKLLNKGSIHTAFTEGNGIGFYFILFQLKFLIFKFYSASEADIKLREEFAKTCFETLLQFSLLENMTNHSTENGQ